MGKNLLLWNAKISKWTLLFSIQSCKDKVKYVIRNKRVSRDICMFCRWEMGRGVEGSKKVFHSDFVA
jgi:translation elongation factor EF-Ts